MSEDKPDTAKKSSLDAMVIDIAIRLAFVGLLAYWSLLLIGPFVLIVLWGVILAVTLYPIFSWLKAKLGGRGGLTATLITLVFLAILIGPASLLGTIFADDLQSYSSKIEANQVQVPPPNEEIKDWPLVGEDLYQFWNLASINLDVALGRIEPQLKTLGAALLSAAAGVGLGFLQFAVSIIIAGFLFSPAIALTNGTKAFARRIASDRGIEFVDLSVATIRNVARGVIGVSLFQSLLGGIGLVVADVPGAGIIAFGVLLLGIIQIAPGIPLLATVIWAWTGMDTLGALIFTVYMVPVSLLDNFLKPIVMAAGLATPMLVVFIGAIGGTLAHGLIGLFIGPIVLAVAYELVVAWVKSNEETESNP
jgi:predicted PurR-regulated permease PerM